MLLEPSPSSSKDVKTSFGVSMIALALARSEHTSAEAAFEILSQSRKESEEGIFWGDEKGCSLSLRTTALALAVFAHRGEIMSRQIAKWINVNMRKWKHTSQDLLTYLLTLEAMRAWKSRKQPSSPSLSSSSSNPDDDNGSKSQEAQITLEYLGFRKSLQLHNFKSQNEIVLKNFGGPLAIQGQGTGTWIFQLSTGAEYSSSSPESNLVKNTQSPLEVTVSVEMGSFGNALLTTCQR